MYEITKPVIDMIADAVGGYLAERNAKAKESNNIEEKEVCLKQMTLAGNIICMFLNLKIGESITRVSDDGCWPIFRAED